MDDAVHEIHVLIVEPPHDGGLVFFEARVFFVHHVHISFGRDELERQFGQNAQRPERTVHHLENERVFIVGFADQNFAFGRNDFVFGARIVEPAVHERHRFNGAARYSAPDRNGLEFGDDNGDETVAHGGFDQVDESDARLRDANTFVWVDVQNLIEIADVDLVVASPEVPDFGYLVRYGFFARRNGCLAGAIA